MSKENDIWLPEIDINSHYLETTSFKYKTKRTRKLETASK